MQKRTQLHDGIVGSLITVLIIIGFKFNVYGFYAAGAVGVLMISSMFTGFCPVYYLIDKFSSPLAPVSKDS